MAAVPVEVPLGDWLGNILAVTAPYLLPILQGLAYASVGLALPTLSILVSRRMVNDAVARWLNGAVNATHGATSGMKLSVPVADAVLRALAQHVADPRTLNMWGRMAVRAAGGPKAVVRRAFGMLHLSPECSAATVLLPVLEKLNTGTLLPPPKRPTPWSPSMNAIMEQFTTAQLTAALRGILLFAFGGLVSAGYLTDVESQTIAGSVAGLAILGYGIYKRRANGLIQSAAKVATVEKIVTDAKTAEKVPSHKVVPPAVKVASAH